ncbi:MAG: hypothetical protein ACREQY_22470 [Candidatus Binatia bacterium]
MSNRTTNPSHPKDMLPIFRVYHAETDRGAAIVAASLLDDLLEQLLRRSMLPCASDDFFRGYGPLSSFSAKIDLARFLGLIGRGEYSELHRIRKIRNVFAHSLDPELSFDPNRAASDRGKSFARREVAAPACAPRRRLRLVDSPPRKNQDGPSGIDADLVLLSRPRARQAWIAFPNS